MTKHLRPALSLDHQSFSWEERKNYRMKILGIFFPVILIGFLWVDLSLSKNYQHSLGKNKVVNYKILDIVLMSILLINPFTYLNPRMTVVGYLSVLGGMLVALLNAYLRIHDGRRAESHWMKRGFRKNENPQYFPPTYYYAIPFVFAFLMIIYNYAHWVCIFPPTPELPSEPNFPQNIPQIIDPEITTPSNSDKDEFQNIQWRQLREADSRDIQDLVQSNINAEPEDST